MTDLIKVLIACLALIGGAIGWAVGHFVSAAMFDEHLTDAERRYVLDLKAEIRQIDKDIDANPDNRGLRDDREELLDELCELRPSDRLCK